MLKGRGFSRLILHGFALSVLISSATRANTDQEMLNSITGTVTNYLTDRQGNPDLWKEELKRYVDAVRATTAPKGSPFASLSGSMGMMGPDPDNDPLFPQDPVDRPVSSGGLQYGLSVPSYRGLQGAAYIVGMETLYQTLNFFGVVHYAEKRGNQIQFQVIESKQDYFQNLDRLSVAYAIREFSRYLTAHMCGDPSVNNFYKAFVQVEHTKMGLRFKYDMAWALLGNSLPREPNTAFANGQRWGAFSKLLQGSKSLSQVQDENIQQEVRNYTILISDILGLVSHLNKLMCYVDITPNAREEIKKRVVVTKLLKLERDLYKRYEPMKQIIDQMEKAGDSEKRVALGLDPATN